MPSPTKPGTEAFLPGLGRAEGKAVPLHRAPWKAMDRTGGMGASPGLTCPTHPQVTLSYGMFESKRNAIHMKGPFSVEADPSR